MTNLNVYVNGLQYSLRDEASAKVFEDAKTHKDNGAISEAVFDQYRKSLLVGYPREAKKPYRGRRG